MQHFWLKACLVSSFVSSQICDARVRSDQNEGGEEKIVVTGSLIKKIDQKGPAPILSLTSEDMQRMGHTNLYDALLALTAQTGSLLEGDQFPNGFTSAAQAINLRGFGPGRTLVLVNGQRLALNPTPYQSEANFFNFATIPTVAIERVDVLTDGASAIYGSDAVAGVVNVILREEFDTHEISGTVSSTSGGGGGKKLSGGNSWRDGARKLTFGYQWESRDPIYAADRSYLFDPNLVTVSAGTFNLATEQFELLGAANCSNLGLQQVLTTIGNVCASRELLGDNIRNKRESTSIYSHGSYELNRAKVFANLIWWQSDTASRSTPLYWEGGLNDVNNDAFYGIRDFFLSETGNQDKQFKEETLSFIAGIEGFTNAFDYQVSYAFSQYDSERSLPLFIESEINQFFSQAEDIYVPYQPSDFAGILGNSINDADSSSNTLSYWMSGDAFSVTEKASEYALIVEWNKTDYAIDVDDITGNFGWYGLGGSSGGGDRSRLAIGAEWFGEVYNGNLGSLELTLATRWDDYQDDSNVSDAQTWKSALLWRINSAWSVSAVHSTSFRAPDLHYLFADQTRYFVNVIDLERCVNVNGNSYESCQTTTDNNYNYSTQVDWQGTFDIEEEEGTTQTIGLFYNPDPSIEVSLDYFDIKLNNQVGLQLESQYLLTEAQCNAGFNFVTNETIDSNSDVCVDAYARINRNITTNRIQAIENRPVNRAFRRQKGLEFAITWFHKTDVAGTFSVDFNHSEILKTEVQQLATDISTLDRNFHNSPFNGDINTRTNLSGSWAGDSWSAALSFYRKGHKINANGTDKISPWTTANLIVNKSFENDHQVSFIIRNLFDKKPPIDSTETEWPYFNRGIYNAVGQEWFFEYKARY